MKLNVFQKFSKNQTANVSRLLTIIVLIKKLLTFIVSIVEIDKSESYR